MGHLSEFQVEEALRTLVSAEPRNTGIELDAGNPPEKKRVELSLKSLLLFFFLFSKGS